RAQRLRPAAPGLRPDGARHGPGHVADEHRRDERGRPHQGRRRVGRPGHDPHDREHVRRGGDGRARRDDRPLEDRLRPPPRERVLGSYTRVASVPDLGTAPPAQSSPTPRPRRHARPDPRPQGRCSTVAVDSSQVAHVETEPGELPKTMAAWVIREERQGEPTEAFQIEEIEVPEPGAFEVIVRVMAAGVNYNNVWAALGQPVGVWRYGDHPEYGHHIGGSDASGVVWKVG